MTDSQILIEHIENKEKMAAMVAPSFPIVFNYPAVITMLRKVGFTYVVEVAAGAKKTNEELLNLLESDASARYVTSPCPTIVRMVKKQMPQYAKYFTHGVDSPMAATAKIVHEQYPGYQPVFIGPCVAKKLEASEDVPELNILVLTYYELQEVFDHYGITEETAVDDHFDIAEAGMTRMYPVDGGLAHSSGLHERMAEDEIRITSGFKNNAAALKEFDKQGKIKLLDILNCPGGCIGGPGIRSKLTIEERKRKIEDYFSKRG